ncbi:MAG: hypothetical protein QT02_C0004G0026 [archaeon GW2011_AR9]|nr:MAG: hypothetical protein QT02_C0004G0026 [archaeon GW2011_AR9]MBS3120405.1 hypothetical protein [Candidatus Woesearchaeota archaeon]HIG93837.1 hypothetical protein [Candidatus Woesearchaeota archaeon]HIH12788.1 hypothetical protein [Candidatus Woesearchaeota archaeon]
MDLGAIVDGYVAFQQQHPILGSIATAEATFSLGDIISQRVTDGKVDWKKVRYTAAFSPLHGMACYASMQIGELVGQYIADDPLAKAALGPNLFGNAYNLFFFANNTIGEKIGYHLHQGKEYYHHLTSDFWANIPKEEYAKSVIGTLTAWNVIQYYNYAYVAQELRTSVALGVGTLWIGLMSLWSLKGRRKIVQEKNESPLYL